MKRALVIGSGAGGATAAKELQGAFDVTVLEAGEAVPSPVPQPANPGKAEKHAPAVRRASDSFSLPSDADPQDAGYGAGERHRHRWLDRHLLRQCRAHGPGPAGARHRPRFGVRGDLPGDPHLHGAPKGLAQAYQAALPDISGDGPAADAHAQDGRFHALQELRSLHVRLSRGGEVGQPAVPGRGRGRRARS